MKKRGYIFTMDVFIAIIIIVVGIVVLLGMFSYAPEKAKTDELSTDVIGLLASIKIKELCTITSSSCSCTYTTLESICSEIDDEEISLLELFGQLYYTNRRDKIEPIVDEIFFTGEIFPQNYGLKIMLYDPDPPEKEEQLYPMVVAP